jgi:hypothetical protein
MKLRLFTFVICLFAKNVWAQKTTLTLATLYGNNVSYYGQSTEEKLPYVLVNATLRLPAGLYFSAGSYKLFNYGSGISETDLGIGYDHAFTKQLNAAMSYTRSFYPENSPLLRAANENNINATVDYQWPWVKSSLSADYAFGMENDVFIGLSHAKSIELGTLFDKNDLIAIEPAIELVAGTQHFYKTYTIQKIKNGKSMGKGNKNNEETTIIPATSFNLFSYNFKLPLSYSRSNYMAEVCYQFSILGKKAITEAKKEQSYLNLSFYYQF